MERTQRGLIIAVFGVIIFVVSLFIILPIEGFYLMALVMMFVSVVMIGMGTALARGMDGSLDSPEDPCYFCKGSGNVEGDGGSDETCPRCGGTGLARTDDQE